jgi:hypothetical protein
MIARIQRAVDLARDPARLHALEQVEAELELLRPGPVEVVEGADRRAHPRLVIQRIARSALDRLTQRRERLREDVGVDRFLSREIRIDGAGGVPGRLRDGADRGAFQPRFGEDVGGGGENAGALEVTNGVAALVRGEAVLGENQLFDGRACRHVLLYG